MNKVTDKKYIIWDFDGTIVNSEPVQFIAFQQAVKELYGEQYLVGWDVYKKIIGARFDFFKQVMAPYIPFDLEATGFREKQEDYCDRMMDEDCPLTEGTADVIRDLKKRGYRMCIASSSPREYVAHYVERIGLKDCFDFLVTGEQVQNSKPAPDIFLKAVGLFDATPEECVVVEDSKNGVLAGASAKIYTVGYQNYDSGDQDLSAADVIIEQMKELAELLA